MVEDKQPRVRSKAVHPVAVPGLDGEAIEAFAKELTADRKRRAEAEVRRFVRRINKLEAALKLTEHLPRPDNEQELTELARSLISEESEEPDDVTPPNGKNPSRFAPYDGDGHFVSRWGLHDYQVVQNVRGGAIGGRLISWPGGGAAYHEVDVGFYTWADADRTLFVQANAVASLDCRVVGGLFGYATAMAGLEVGVSRYGRGGEYQRFASRRVLYDQSRVAGFDSTTFVRNTNVGVAVPVRRGDLLWLCATAVQNVASGGPWHGARSQVTFFVGPISW